MKEKSVEVLALSEVRWPGHGVSHLEDTTIIAHSGRSDRDSHQCSRGVAVLLSERASSAWRSAGSVFDPVSERILRIHLKSHTGFMSLIAVYAPTKIYLEMRRRLRLFTSLCSLLSNRYQCETCS